MILIVPVVWVALMNKPEATNWCNQYLKEWPESTEYAFPLGWRWVTDSSNKIILSNGIEIINQSEVNFNVKS